MSKILQFPTQAGLDYPSKPVTSTLVPLSGGRAGIVQTLAMMRNYVNRFRVNNDINALAVRLVNRLNQKDYLGEIETLFNYVKNSIRYTRDVNNVETVRDPEITLKMKAGDCDDKATLLATLLETVGFVTRFHAMGRIPGKICHVIVEVQNPVNGLWIPLETTNNVPMGWLPPDIAQSIYYYEGGKTETVNGFFSSAISGLKKIVSGGAHLAKTSVKTTAGSVKDLSKGDVKGALSTEWAGAKDEAGTANQLRKDINATVLPPFVVDAENRLTDATVKALASKQGSVVLSILSMIPVTAPFALAVQGGLVIAQAEAVRKALNAMDKAKRDQSGQALSTVRYVYDPAINAIRERQKTGDENLTEFKYVNGQLIQLTSEELGNVNRTLSAKQKQTVIDKALVETAKKYPEYAAALKQQLATPNTIGELGFGWTDAISQIATQVASSYASGKVAAKFANDQVNNQLKVINAQLKAQPQTPPVQGQRDAIDELTSFTTPANLAIIGGLALTVFLLVYFSKGKRK